MIWLLLLLAATTTAKKSSYLSDIPAYTERIQAVDKSLDDNPLLALKSFSQSVRKQISLADSVGTLTARGAQKDLKSDATSQRAIVSLNKAMSERFNVLDTRLSILNEKLMTKDLLMEMDYRQNVTEKLATLQVLFVNATHTSFKVRRETKKGFTEACNAKTTSPLTILHLLDRTFRMNCNLTTPEMITKFNELQGKVREQEANVQKLEESTDDPFLNLLTALLKSLLRFAKLMMNQSFDSITGKRVPVDLPNDQICIPGIIFNEHDHTRDALENTVARLTIDLQKTLIFASACSHLTLDGNAARIDYVMNNTAEYIEELGTHVEKWVRSMQTFWPYVSSQYAMKALGEETGPAIKVDKYNETAHLVRQQFRVRGPENRDYQVVVTGTKKENVSWILESIDNSTVSTVQNYRGLDIHVFQFKIDDSERFATVQQWFGNNEKALLENLRLNATSDSALDMFNSINETIPLYSKDAFRSALVFRNNATANNTAAITLATATDAKSYKIGLTEQKENTNYAWKILFFL